MPTVNLTLKAMTELAKEIELRLISRELCLITTRLDVLEQEDIRVHNI